MSALTDASGSYPIVRRRRAERGGSPWEPPAWMAITGWVLAAITPFLIALYVLAYAASADPSLRGLLIAGVCAAPLGALVAAVGCALDRRARERQAEARDTADQTASRLRAMDARIDAALDARYEADQEIRLLPRRVITIAETQAELYRDELAGLRGQLGGRMAALERELAQQRKLLAQAAEAEAILARSQNGGSVLPFPPTGRPHGAG